PPPVPPRNAPGRHEPVDPQHAATRVEPETPLSTTPQPAGHPQVETTPELRRAIAQSGSEALRLHHGYVGSAHLMFAILDQGPAREFLLQHGITPTAMHQAVAAVIPSDGTLPVNRIDTRPETNELVTAAARRARENGRDEIGTGQVLLELLRREGHDTSQVPRHQGIDPRDLRDEAENAFGYTTPDRGPVEAQG